MKTLFSFLAAAMIAGSCHAVAQQRNHLDGTWVFQKEHSTSIDPWVEWAFDINTREHSITMVKSLRSGRYGQKDTIRVTPDGKPHTIPMHPGKWLENVHLAVYGAASAERTVTATTTDSTLQLAITEPLQNEQGEAIVIIRQRYAVSQDIATLTMDETRSSRTSGPPLHYVFSRTSP